MQQIPRYTPRQYAAMALELGHPIHLSNATQQELNALAIEYRCYRSAIESPIRTVLRSELSTIKMTTGGEKQHATVIDGTTVKQWVGIGWIDERHATTDDYLRYPTVVDDKADVSKDYA